MKMRVLTFIILIFICISSHAQMGNPDSLQVNQIKANKTDADIAFELANHYTFYNPTATSTNTLLVYLPGSYDNPKNTLLFPSLAANHGIQAIGLKYENGIASKSACGTSTDTTCFQKFRREILYGIDVSSEVSVDITNSIENRLQKLLIYLIAEEPNNGWGEFYSNGLLWDKIMFAGHSQGGGHAALLGIDYKVNRVMMFSSPNDFNTQLNLPAKWLSEEKKSSNAVFFGFNNLNDDVVDFAEQKAVWDSLNFDVSHDTVDVDKTARPFNSSQMLYTKVTGTGVAYNHSATVRDNETPLDMNGDPIFQSVWEYMLGVNKGATIENVQQHVSFYPNPAKDIIYLKSNFKAIEIYSTMGSKCFIETEGNMLDISSLLPGLYTIHLKTDAGLIRKKLIKQ